MRAGPDISDRHGAILGRLAELGLSLAERLHEAAMTAETPEQTADLGRAFHTLSRSVRQTLALEAKLQRDRQQAMREDAVEIRLWRDRAQTRRKAQVEAAVERLIWTEREGDEAEVLQLTLSDQLDEAMLYDSFDHTPIETLITKIADNLGLPPNFSLPFQGEGDSAPVERGGAPPNPSG